MNIATTDKLTADARAAVTVGRPADELRALWLRPDTQSRIWSHFAEVTLLDDRTADWTAHGPAGGEYRWRIQIEDTAAHEVRWSSLDGADVANASVLAFRPAPGDRGTELHLRASPGRALRFPGIIGQAVSKLFHIVPGEIVSKALYKFRALALTGEIPTTDPQPAARHGGADR